MKVFISHKSSDALWARKLAESLRAEGIHAWLDIWDMPPGKPLSDAMQDGITECDAMILILTKASVDAIRAGRGGISFEVHIGEGRTYNDIGFRIIGIKRGDCDPPEKLRNRIGRWLDFTDDTQYSEKLGELTAWLKGGTLGPCVSLSKEGTFDKMQWNPILKSRSVPLFSLVLGAASIIPYTSNKSMLWLLPPSSPIWIYRVVIYPILLALPLIVVRPKRLVLAISLLSCLRLLYFSLSSDLSTLWLSRLIELIFIGGLLSAMFAYDKRSPYRVIPAYAGFVVAMLGTIFFIQSYMFYTSNPIYWFLTEGFNILMYWLGIVSGDWLGVFLWNRNQIQYNQPKNT